MQGAGYKASRRRNKTCTIGREKAPSLILWGTMRELVDGGGNGIASAVYK